MTSGGKDKRWNGGLHLILTEDAQKPRSLLHFDAFGQKNIDPLRIKRMVKITWYGSHDWGFLFWRCWCEARVFHCFCCTQVFKWNVAWSYTDLSNHPSSKVKKRIFTRWRKSRLVLLDSKPSIFLLIHRIRAPLDALKTLCNNRKHILREITSITENTTSETCYFNEKQNRFTLFTCSVCADFLMNVWMHFTRCSSMSWR